MSVYNKIKYQQLIFSGLLVKCDNGLEFLFSLDGTEYTEENGYWYKIEVAKIEPSTERPHGIRYNLTLHDNFNQRILGFDNAHPIVIKKGGRYGGRIFKYDHMHKTMHDKGTPYKFECAEKLLSDFFKEVNKVLNTVNGRGT